MSQTKKPRVSLGIFVYRVAIKLQKQYPYRSLCDIIKSKTERGRAGDGADFTIEEGKEYSELEVYGGYWWKRKD